MGNPNATPLAGAKRGAGGVAGLVLALVALSSIAAPASDMANVDDARIIENAKTGKEWLSNGLDYGANRFSALDQVTTANVGKLGLAWSYSLDSIRGVEATPIVVDGIMYVTAPWAIVHAINAKTGEKIWTFDPQSPRSEGYRLCCDVVNRGVAVYKGKVYVGTPDSHLIALDAATGKMLWTVDTSPDRTRPYTLTGRRSSPRERSSSEAAAESMAFAAFSARSTPRPASWHGAGTRCRATLRNRSRTKRWPRLRRPGTTSSTGGRMAAADRSGTRSL